MAQMHEFVTSDGVTITAPLNLNRQQWIAYKAVEGGRDPEKLWMLADALGVDADALGILDLRRWAGEWDQALADALGVSLGESESSSKPSSGSTGRPSRSTSAGSRKSR